MQRAIVNLKTHPLLGISLIEASAGTGKTYTISHLYLRCLLETEYDVRQILVVTFTNAATQELRGRIRKLLHKASLYLTDCDSKNQDFDTLIGNYQGQVDAQVKLQKALANFDEAAIYSIHGFCQRVLNSFPLETRSLLQPQILANEKQLEMAAIRDFWRKNMVDCETDRLRWILSLWKEPDQLLAEVTTLLGFEDSVQKMAQHDSTALLQTLELLWKKLCDDWRLNHKAFFELLAHSPALNHGRIRVSSVEKLFQALADIFCHPLPYVLPEKWELITLGKLTSSLKKNQQEPRLAHAFFTDAERFEQLHGEWIRQNKISLLIDAALQVQGHVNDAKKRAQNVSFNDLIRMVSEVMKQNDSLLIDRVNQQYPIAMVDEFQDTDQRQYRIFKTLYQNQQHSALIMIGDPKQAIYSFRGADVFTYQQAKQSTDKQFTLETNYRSSDDYIDMVNTLFAQQDNAFIFEQLIEFQSVRANEKNQSRLTEQDAFAKPLVCWLHPYTEKPLNKGDANAFFSSLCAQEIQRILDDQSLHIDGAPVQARDLAVLVKTGRQASLIKNQLAQRGISSALVLRDSVFASDQAREITQLLEVLTEPANIRRLCGLLSSDLFAWNAQQIYQLQQDNTGLVEILDQIRAYQQHWQQHGILSMFFRLLDEQQTLSHNLQHMEGERRVTNWLHIVELLQQNASRHASHSQALQWLLLQRHEAINNMDNEEHQLRLESDSDLVRIVTIHKSKGLEYPIVFLPFMWDMKSKINQPSSYSVHDVAGNKQLLMYDESQRERWYQENLGEEIRLFYVAITRARYRSYIGWGSVRGAGSSAIGHCLYQAHLKPGSYPQDLEFSEAGEYRQPWIQLNADRHRVELIESITEDHRTESLHKASIDYPPLKIFRRRITQQWRISSYSQLSSSGHDRIADQPDYDAIPLVQRESESIEQQESLSRFSFHKGAKAGNFLHDILELQVFDQAIDEMLIENKCQEYGYDRCWLPVLKEWISDILHCSLGQFSLSQITPVSRISEMEFYLSLQQLNSNALNHLLQENEYLRPGQAFSFTEIRGFLKGYIDLVFEHDGRFFIADYKSNYLGDKSSDYNHEKCKTAMFDHHYHLQYLIYMLALHRYLKNRIDGYDYDHHVGGVYYLFLRGMCVQDPQLHGVFFHKPEKVLIEQMERLFE